MPSCQPVISIFLCPYGLIVGRPEKSFHRLFQIPDFSLSGSLYNEDSRVRKRERRLKMEKYAFVTLREIPQRKEEAAAWFHEKWQVPVKAYLECMEAYLHHETEYGWYLCLHEQKIVGGLGVIANDFHERRDLTPNICAVYTEKEYRSKGIAGRLLNMAVEDLRAHSISVVYVLTDHTSFYERYGFEFLCMAQNTDSQDQSRMYIHR